MAVKKNMEAVEVEQKSGAELENEQLRKQLEEMKAMMEQLVANQNKTIEVKKDSNNDIFQDNEDVFNINLHKPINVVSLVVGGLNLQGANGKSPIHFRDFGVSKPVSYEDVRAFVDNHHQLAKEGGFVIQDRNVVKALYLEEDYQNFLSKEKIENLIDLPGKEIVNTLKSVSKTLRDTIIQYFIRQIPKDNRYTDWNKIKLINDYIGEDLMKLANQVEGIEE